MSTKHVTQLPDPYVYGSADTSPVDTQKLRVAVTTTGGNQTLLHAHIGGVYIATTERNWRAIVNALQTLEVPAETVTHRISMDDETGTATIETTVTP